MSDTQDFQVTGMTCGHCVRAVTDELTSLAGVSEVRVDLDPEGASTLHVTSDSPLSDAVVADALDEAGDYQLA